MFFQNTGQVVSANQLQTAVTNTLRQPINHAVKIQQALENHKKSNEKYEEKREC